MSNAETELTGTFMDNPFHHSNTIYLYDLTHQLKNTTDEVYSEASNSSHPEEHAKTGHLKFMGIPLDGTISQFEEKLIRKGAKLDQELNSRRANGEACRYYSGSFSGRAATIKIKYNYMTKIVWGAMVSLPFKNKDVAESELKYFKEKLLCKYPLSSAQNTIKEGIPSVMLCVCDNRDCYGFIYLYTVTPTKSQKDKAYLILNYKDYINTEKNESKNLEDL